jgi:hypothetical protein
MKDTTRVNQCLKKCSTKKNLIIGQKVGFKIRDSGFFFSIFDGLFLMSDIKVRIGLLSNHYSLENLPHYKNQFEKKVF